MKKTITVPAQVDKLDNVLGFIEGELEKTGCSMKCMTQMNIAAEEIFVNIAHYAYTPNTGDADISLEITGEPLSVSLSFSDSGKPYNPLEKPDPDITLSADERSVGGLGIYMVKKSMDKMDYEYKDGKNILTLKKNLV